MMTHIITNEKFIDLAMLNRIEVDPDVSQAALAEDLGVAIGTVNGRLKRLVDGGFIQVNRAGRRKLRYIITAEGRALQRTLTAAYIQHSFQLYRQVRLQVQDLLLALNDSGVHAVRLVGEGEIADVCRLTCLEHHISATDDADAPALVVDGLHVRIEQE